LKDTLVFCFFEVMLLKSSFFFLITEEIPGYSPRNIIFVLKKQHT